MKVDLNPKEIDLLASELESSIRELRGLIASSDMRKETRDDIRKDKIMLMDILVKVKTAAVEERQKAAA